MAIPQPLIIILPFPAACLTVLLLLYHASPLLRLLQNPTPFLSSLSRIIPHPRRNLPREFFNLPPRATEDEGQLSVSTVLGVQGKLMLFLGLSALLSIAGGWSYLLSDSSRAVGGLALSTSLLPVATMWIAIFVNSQHSSQDSYSTSRIHSVRRMVMGEGGITHSTIPRIALYSLLPTAIVTFLSIGIPSAAKMLLLVTSSLSIAITLGVSMRARLRSKRVERGMIRLASPCPSPLPRESSPLEKPREPSTSHSARGLEGLSDWVSSPGNAPTSSSFSYSPSYKTPHRSSSSLRDKSRSTTDNGTPTSWLTSPTNTPASIPEWQYSPSIATPALARTRSRSPSPSLRGPSSRGDLTSKASATTLGDRTYLTGMSTPGSGIRGAGGSVIGAYSPDPFEPMPRGYESLATYPLSPDDLASRVTLATHPAASSESLAFVPSRRGPSASRGVSSTWTFESYHSAAESFKTPVRGLPGDRRAAPPPPLPDQPLPQTPSAGRSETLFDWPTGKESTEMLMMDRERDWVEVEGFVNGSEGWGDRRSGVGVVAMIGVVVCYALTTPILIQPTDATTILYLISQLLPPPILATISFLLRYRPAQVALPVTSRSAKSSTTSHHLSLALRSDSQLSLPISISPKLTPPAARKASVALGNRLPRLVEAKPSISNFGWTRSSPDRRHTMYGAPTATRDIHAEEAMRRTMARRSADVWVMEGHAHASENIFKRAAEMLKPVPALRVLDGPLSAPVAAGYGPREQQEGVMKKLRGGITSLIPNRWSQQLRVLEDAENAARISTEMVAVPPSPIAIEISSPSKFDRRRISGVSTAEVEGEGDAEGHLDVEGLGEVKMAQKGRMSASPTFVFTGPRGPTSPVEEGYELDWVTAGVLPGLVPTIKIGDDILVRPASMSIDPNATPKKSGAHLHSRAESVGGTPRGHGRSTSIDYAAAGSSPVKSSIRNRHSPSRTHPPNLSLPAIATADFEDVRRSVDSTGRDDLGVDMPPFPTIDFSQPHKSILEEEGDVSGITTLSAMAAIYREADMTLGTPRNRHHSDATTVHLTPETRKMAAIARQMERELKTPSTGRTTRSITSSRLADATLEITSEMVKSIRSNITFRSPNESDTIDRSRLSPLRHGSISDEVGMTSMISEDQAMADEMEQVLLMDSPKRAEYVTSPPLSERPGTAMSAKSSRASWMAASEHLYDLDRDTFGAPRKASSASTLASTYTSWSEGMDMAEGAPPVPPLPHNETPGGWKFPTYPPKVVTSSHPHPAPPPALLEDHRPIQPHPSMQSLLRKKSAETMASVSTFEHSPPKWDPSRKELEMLETLKQRAALPVTATSKPEVEGRKGLRELKLANTESANKRASKMAAKETKRVSVLGKKDGLPKPVTRGLLSPAKASRGSGKENGVGGAGKRSKASAGSGLSGLRA